MPLATQWASATTAGNKIYVAGGMGPTAVAYGTIHVYTPTTDTWATGIIFTYNTICIANRHVRVYLSIYLSIHA
jgi:hypothetical protein